MHSNMGIWFYIKSYKFNSVFTKNFLLILLLIFLPLAGISVAVYNNFNKIIKDEMGAASLDEISRVRDIVDMIAIENDKLSVRLASDIDIENLLSSVINEYPDYETIRKFLSIGKQIGVSTITSDYIDSIYVYSDRNGFILSTNRGSGQLWQFPDRGWVEDYELKKYNFNSWLSLRQVKKQFNSNEYYNFITSFRMIPIYDKSKLGFVAINIDADKLGRLINNGKTEKLEDIFIIDENNRILYYADINQLGTSITENENLREVPLATVGIPLIRNINGIKKVVTMVESKYNKWKYVSAVPLYEVEKKTRYLRDFMVISITVSIISIIIVAFLISVRVFKPIKNIISILKNPAELLNSGLKDNKMNLDEMKFIINNILKSFDEGKKMEEELEHRLVLLKKAQSIALQSQINPHFLFNTLETINWMAMKLTNGDNEVSHIIKSLSELLRISLSTVENFIPVVIEIEHAKRYVEIQKLRYRNKLEVIWDIDESIMECKSIKIVLQPLIENAIYHGIKPKAGIGTITIKGYGDEDSINFEVSDNGVGLSGDAVKSINESLDTGYIKEDQHIGLSNVNQRIRLVFGDGYGVRISSEANIGTSVKIKIPKVKISDHTDNEDKIMYINGKPV